MVSSSLARRIKSLELLARPKEPMLVLHCYDAPDDAQLAQISQAEARGRRVILYGNHYSWVWLSGCEDKPWLEDNSDYDYVRGAA